ncbi:MAG: site-specific DNA-methyltransferase [Peptococcaceae bacterium]|nr:site-specific DNA-methyltransferase [Peptococcaceae bacterium]
MANVTETQKRLLDKLAELFQLDQADLDFGIYRIMNYKRETIKKFLDEELMSQVAQQLQVLHSSGSSKALAEIEAEIKAAGKLTVSDAVKSVMVAELEARKKSIGAVSDIRDVEADIYSHLTDFFSRYYDEGDFISQRRYKDGVYAIPYEGEEVKLHWANADQYYIKTSEYFKEYRFDTGYGKVLFKIVEAETERDNNKAQKKRFFQLFNEHPFAQENNELVIRFEYKDGDKKQDAYVNEAVSEFAKRVKDFPAFKNLLHTGDGKTVLEKHLNAYAARNTFDYFIHKDLKKFLNRELDFYIKNEVMFLDDLDEQDDHKTKEYLTKAKVIRRIARKIVTFLAQIEDFQKKLWLKKKFVVETNYCITLDRVPKSLYPQIIENRAQLDEWVRLFAINEIKPKKGNLFEVDVKAFTVPLTLDFLEQNPHLVLDTAFFPREFREVLVQSIDGLDENIDGVLIHSENFQALQLLGERYREEIKCIYVDPPYNTNASEIAYKNGYKNSSWLSLMADRMTLAKGFMSRDAIKCITIDDVEYNNLALIVEDLFHPDNILGSVVIKNNPSGRSTARGFSIAHEYAIFCANESSVKVGRLERNAEQKDRYDEKDSTSYFEWVNFRKHGGTKAESPKMFYPIYVTEKAMRIPNAEWNNESKCWDVLEKKNDNEIAVYPIDEKGTERRWKWAMERTKSNPDEFCVRNDRSGKLAVYMKARMNDEGMLPLTTWDKKEYSATAYGTNLLKDIFGSINAFTYPKSIHAVEDTLKVCNSSTASSVMDYFAGSGTTGHAVINLNREDGGNRKYILMEMGEYFDTVTKPRIQKVIYSEDWKDGKPISRKGSSHAFKYLRLESYEDTLNNLEITDKGFESLGNKDVQEQYLLSYMLSRETEGSASLLNIDKLDHPFNYALNITRNLESRVQAVDLVETFNYLIGLKVERSYQTQKYGAKFHTGEHGRLFATLISGDTYTLKAVEGRTLSGEKVLVIWRDHTDDKEKDNAVLDAYLEKRRINPSDFEFDRVYVNGDNNLRNLRADNETWKVLLIEEEMKKRMFEVN